MPSRAGMNRRQQNAEIRIRRVLEAMAAKCEVEITDLPSRRNALIQDTQRIEWIADALERISARVWPGPETAPKAKKVKPAQAEPDTDGVDEPDAPDAPDGADKS